MRGLWLVRIVPIIVFIVAFAVLGTANLSRLEGDTVFVATLGIFSLSLAYIFYIPIVSKGRDGDDTAQIGTIGVVLFFALAFIVVAGISLYLAITRNSDAAISWNILAMGIFLLGLIVSKIVANFLNYISEKINFRSSHGGWGADVLRIANACVDQNLKFKLLKFSDDLRYLSRDYTREPNAINGKISSSLATIESLVTQGNYSAAEVLINQLNQDISVRESSLKNLRSKV